MARSRKSSKASDTKNKSDDITEEARETLPEAVAEAEPEQQNTSTGDDVAADKSDEPSEASVIEAAEPQSDTHSAEQGDTEPEKIAEKGVDDVAAENIEDPVPDTEDPATEQNPDSLEQADEGATDSETDATSDPSAENPDSDASTAETESSDSDASETDDAARDPDGDTVGASDNIASDGTTEPEDLVARTEDEAAISVEESTQTPPAPEVVTRTETKIVKGSIWPGFFGGVIAALIGFIVGRGDALDNFLPASLQRPAIDTSALEAMETETSRLAGQATELSDKTAELATQTADQNARLQALESAPAPEAAPAKELSDIENSLAQITDRLNALEARPIFEPGPEGADPEVVDALDSALTAQTEKLVAQSEKLAAMQERLDDAEARAATEAAQLLARAALTRVMTAVNTGEAFTPALNDLENVSPVAVPDTLKTAAEAGVPTLAALQEAFPEAARAALAAARADVPESEVSTITGFFRRQLNARSVAPREGDDPDAILSRSEAALKTGDLGTTLSELETLPESGRAAMQDWIDKAEARKTAQDAANTLADSLNSNGGE